MAKIIGIVGPTAVGKTALSIRLAQDLDGEVISGDSMQVYRGLDIGTAKITPQEMAGIPHYLINIRDVNERFSVADFKRLATEKIHEIDKRGKVPFIVGGTGFYLQALTAGLTLGNDHFDEDSLKIRRRWQKVAQDKGDQYVWNSLNEIDPQAAEKIPVHNIRRTIRALEVITKTGQQFSEQIPQGSDDDFFLIGLNTDRQVLYQRINDRVDQMVNDGLLKEAEWLFQKGGSTYQSGKGIGYRELFPYFLGELSLPQAIDKIKLDSRHYAKRQLTWFRNKMTVHWFDLVSGKDNIGEIAQEVHKWLLK